MNDAVGQTLADLRDIHGAPHPSWWPPAPIWWLLAMVLIGALAWIAVTLARRLRRRRLRREVLTELARLHDSWSRHGDSRAFAAELSVLLKRVALSRYPRTDVAGLNTDAWLRFLDQTGGAGAFSSPPGNSLATAPYAPASTINADGLITVARDWLLHNLR